MPDEKRREDPRLAAAKKRATDLAKAAGGGGRSRTSSGQFLKEVWSELKKTTWPDRDTLIKSTYVVLAFIVATGVWVFVVNFVLGTPAPLFTR